MPRQCKMHRDDEEHAETLQREAKMISKGLESARNGEGDTDGGNRLYYHVVVVGGQVQSILPRYSVLMWVSNLLIDSARTGLRLGHRLGVVTWLKLGRLGIFSAEARPSRCDLGRGSTFPVTSNIPIFIPRGYPLPTAHAQELFTLSEISTIPFVHELPLRSIA